MIQLPELTIDQPLDDLYQHSPIGDRMANLGNPVSEWLGKALAQVWIDYVAHLEQVDIVKKIESCNISNSEYQSYLLNMRQQVKLGARWITRAASSMDDQHMPLRDALIRHASQEHKDYLMLEQNYVSVGGNQHTIQLAPSNIGTDALDAYIFHHASMPNPVHVFGATFIIEGMGSVKAGKWANCIRESLQLDVEQVSFLHYHGEADEDHYKNLIRILTSPYVTPEVALKLVRCAKVVGRLYALQLEEIDHV